MSAAAGPDVTPPPDLAVYIYNASNDAYTEAEVLPNANSNSIIAAVANVASSIAIDNIVENFRGEIYQRCYDAISTLNSKSNTKNISKNAAKQVLIAFNDIAIRDDTPTIADSFLTNTTLGHAKYARGIITTPLNDIWPSLSDMMIYNVWEVIGQSSLVAIENAEISNAANAIRALRNARTTTNSNVGTDELLGAAILNAITTTSAVPALNNAPGINKKNIYSAAALSATNIILQLAKTALFQKISPIVIHVVNTIDPDTLPDMPLTATVASLIALARPETWRELAVAVNKTVNRNTEHTLYGENNNTNMTAAAGGAGAAAPKRVVAFGPSSSGGRRRRTHKRSTRKRRTHKRRTHKRRH
jgi:hypothetical protein